MAGLREEIDKNLDEVGWIVGVDRGRMVESKVGGNKADRGRDVRVERVGQG